MIFVRKVFCLYTRVISEKTTSDFPKKVKLLIIQKQVEKIMLIVSVLVLNVVPHLVFKFQILTQECVYIPEKYYCKFMVVLIITY